MNNDTQYKVHNYGIPYTFGGEGNQKLREA